VQEYDEVPSNFQQISLGNFSTICRAPAANVQHIIILYEFMTIAAPEIVAVSSLHYMQR
jgi:hypothetical protein